jgi:hypothetical protein
MTNTERGIPNPGSRILEGVDITAVVIEAVNRIRENDVTNSSVTTLESQEVGQICERLIDIPAEPGSPKIGE